MQVYANQFPGQLQKGLQNFYLIFGDEPLQKLECIDAVRHLAQQQGAEERINLVADTQFQWQQVVDEFQAMSLFSSKKIIELELPTAKPGKEGSETLSRLVELNNPDIILVLYGPKLEAAQTKSKWFKTLDAKATYVPCYPVEGQQLQRWVKQRCQQEQIQVNNDAIGIIADFCEGNLLAASQEIKKLSLLFPHQTITTEQVQENVVNQSRFNVFQLVDQLLAGNTNRALQVLERLESEGLEPTIVLWALQREVFTLLELVTEMNQGQALTSLWQKHRIWKSRQNIYQQAVHRLTLSQLEIMVRQLSQLDIEFKSVQTTKPYIKLAHMCSLFTHFDALRSYSDG